ncbi:hypothetical protein LOTGIDRAFT_195134 [Lottia gigantea]|uniref:Serine protease K12H4.7 n=1 Tax=Lottia gigantea TaxID=225164 RepID=V3ZZH9_LOTGI|nr:hypothetical protein LOTGIDRAFT_195134 [Lottia gigantea]ESO86391.1 hypothetical protein LOTGIDRAFT_195134 [Lottia gigantea]
MPSEMWVTQRQDHFNDANTKTWQQKYYVNDQYYRKGGPVFLMLGGEGPLGPTWMVDGAWIDYAQAYNAMLFSIEHRYYGKSHPTPDMSTENLQYLSSEQALADSAYFIQYCKYKFELQDNKWISFGGSYSGSLSAWLRLKYPHLIDGAVATSAPLLAVIDFKEYLDVTQASLATTGSGCNEGIEEATTAVEKLLQTEDGRGQLKKMFKLCDDIDIENKLDIANLFSNLANNFEEVVQYNKDNRGFEGGVGANITLDVLCDIMTDTSRGLALQRYADVNSLMLSTYSEKCLDFLYYNMIEEMRISDWNKTDSPGGRQWVYQTCTEFGFFQTSDLVEQPFGQRFPLSFWVQQCKDIYGYRFNADLINAGINRTNTNYGAKNIKASRIVFPNGSIDQWHALGKLDNLPAGSTAIFINGTAHCANMYPAAPTDIPELTQTRMTIQKLIGAWIQ